MVDEKEEHYEEEGEYHFSDDQVNYDIEPETPKAAPAAAGFSKDAVLTKLTQNRRKVLGVVAFIILIGVVYKILVPASTTPSTDFTQAATPKATKPSPAAANAKNATPSRPVEPVIAQPTMPQAPAVETKPVSAPLQQSQQPDAMVAVAPTQPPATVQAAPVQTLPGAPTNGMPPTSPMTQPVMPPMVSPSQMQAQTTTQPPSVMTQPIQTTTSVTTMQTAPVDAQTKDRLAALEQQNTAMMNLLQTEYAQKIADAETQTNAVRGKIEELNKRVNRIETNLNQITQLLQGMSKSQVSGVMSNAAAPMYNVPSRSAEPRIAYSVQAIIPGRAWLKSEGGDTVTVAEGDYLKRYGRVTKIDPYDGIVAIDTGNKVITLSYGLDSE